MLECYDLKQEITRLQSSQDGKDVILEEKTKDDNDIIVQNENQEHQPTKQGNFILHVCLDGWSSGCIKQAFMSIRT